MKIKNIFMADFWICKVFVLFLFFIGLSDCFRSKFKTDHVAGDPIVSGKNDCSRINGFTSASEEHFSQKINETFVVREIRGRILNTARDYGWPADIRVLFEIRKTGKGKVIHRTNLDENGYFWLRGIADGVYCFKSTINGWRSCYGRIIKTKKANSNRVIVFAMEMGV